MSDVLVWLQRSLQSVANRMPGSSLIRLGPCNIHPSQESHLELLRTGLRMARLFPWFAILRLNGNRFLNLKNGPSYASFGSRLTSLFSLASRETPLTICDAQFSIDSAAIHRPSEKRMRTTETLMNAWGTLRKVRMIGKPKSEISSRIGGAGV